MSARNQTVKRLYMCACKVGRRLTGNGDSQRRPRVDERIKIATRTRKTLLRTVMTNLCKSDDTCDDACDGGGGGEYACRCCSCCC